MFLFFRIVGMHPLRPWPWGVSCGFVHCGFGGFGGKV